MDSEDLVAVRLRYDFHEAARVLHDHGFRDLLKADRIACAPELPGTVCFRIRGTHRGDRRIREHRVGHRAVIHFEPSIREGIFRSDVAFLGRGRLEHGLADYVAAREDVAGRGAHLRVDLHAPILLRLDAGRVKVQAFGVRIPTGCHQESLRLEPPLSTPNPGG